MTRTVKFPQWIMEADLSASDKFLLLLLIISNENIGNLGYASCAHSTYALRMKCSEEEVSAGIGRLIQSGYAEAEKARCGLYLGGIDLIYPKNSPKYFRLCPKPDDEEDVP